jgi:hypothetical protein
VRVYQFRHIRGRDHLSPRRAANLAPRLAVLLLDHREVLEVALDARSEVVFVGLDDAQALLATPTPRSPDPSRRAGAEAYGESRPLGSDDEEYRAHDQDDREDPHGLILVTAAKPPQPRFGD